MPENTIREQTFCCGGGAGLGNDENMEMRLRGGLPRANAVRYVHEKHGVNLLACICAIDKATLSTLVEYWVPEVDVSGVHELVGNALVMRGREAEDDATCGASRWPASKGDRRCMTQARSSPAWRSSWRWLLFPVWQSGLRGSARKPEPKIVTKAKQCVRTDGRDARRATWSC